jgi:hypothetical protein
VSWRRSSARRLVDELEFTQRPDVGSASVIRDERPYGVSDEVIAEDAEREREPALGDSPRGPGEHIGEVIFEALLALEVGDDLLDDVPGARRSISAGGRCPSLCLAGYELDVNELYRATELAPPQSLVAEEQAAGLGEPVDRLVLLGAGREEVIAGRHPSTSDSSTSRIPTRPALRGALAVVRVRREFAPRGAIGVIGATDERAVGEPDPALGDERRHLERHRRDVGREPAQAAVVLRLLGQVRKPAPKPLADQTQELAIRGLPHRRLGDPQRDQLLVGDLALRLAARNRRPRTHRLR